MQLKQALTLSDMSLLGLNNSDLIKLLDATEYHTIQFTINCIEYTKYKITANNRNDYECLGVLEGVDHWIVDAYIKQGYFFCISGTSDHCEWIEKINESDLLLTIESSLCIINNFNSEN